MVVFLAILILAFCVMIPALIVAWSKPTYRTDIPRDDYPYPRKGTDVSIEFPTLIDTGKFWTPNTRNMRKVS